MKEMVKVPFNDLSRIHRQLISDFHSDLDKVVLESSFIMGDLVHNFEANLTRFEGSKFAVSVNSGTSALELSLRALNIGPGDEVIIPSFTFVATAFAVLQAGAIPILADVHEDQPLLDINSCQQLITSRTKAIIFVTLHGRVQYLERFVELCEAKKIHLVIDGAQSHLARYMGSPLSYFAKCVSLSFYPGKNLGALGEGGAVLTNDEEIANKIKSARNWGAKQRYIHDEWGGNFRLDTLQCGFLNRKIEFLPTWTEQRRTLGKNYDERLPIDIRRPSIAIGEDHVYHVYDVLVDNRQELVSRLLKLGIETGIHYPLAIHQNGNYRNLLKVNSILKNSEYQAKKTLSLPLFPGMTEREQNYVIETFSSIYSK